MSKQKININKLADTVMNELGTFCTEVSDNLEEAIIEAGKQCKTELKRRSPKKTGDYAKGWTRRTKTKKVGRLGKSVKVIIENKTDQQLTHLLEYGHVVKNKKNGRILGTAPAYPHISIARNHAEAYLLRRLRDVAK